MLVFFAVVITFFVVIGFHEWGHAYAARLLGVQIERISIGFGKPILSWRWRKLNWVLATWPLGGYVQMLNTRIAPVAPAKLPYCFDRKPLWVRCMILLAGSMANIVLAWFLLSIVAMVGTRQYVPVIGTVTPSSIAALAEVKPGDRIIGVGEVSVSSWFDASIQMITAVGQKKVKLTVEGIEKTPHTVTLDLSHIAWQLKGPSFFAHLGFQPDLNPVYWLDVKPLGLLQSSLKATYTLGQLFWFVLIIVKQLLMGLIPLTVLMGPLSFYTQVSAAFAAGIGSFMRFLALLSFLVGLINLLPVPGLDGGSLVYAGIEKLRNKPLSVRLEILLYRLAMIVLGLLLVQLILNDLQRLTP